MDGVRAFGRAVWGAPVGAAEDTAGWARFSGLLCVAGSSLLYSFMGLLVKLLAAEDRVPTFQTVLVRSVLVAAASAAVLLHQLGPAAPLLGRPDTRPFLLARSVVGFFALSSYYCALSDLPLKDATTLNFSAPIFTALLAAVFLKEPFTPSLQLASFAAFAGVLLIARPPFLFGGPHEPGRLRGVAIALGGAALTGASYTLLRVVGKAGEPPLVSVLWFSVVGVVGSPGMMLVLGTPPVTPSALEWAALLALAASAFGGQVLVSRGLQIEAAGRAISMQYIKVLASYLLGIVVLGERPTLSGLAGAVLIVVAAGFVTAETAGQSGQSAGEQGSPKADAHGTSGVQCV